MMNLANILTNMTSEMVFSNSQFVNIEGIFIDDEFGESFSYLLTSPSGVKIRDLLSSKRLD